jgi:hypothetical protein
MHAVVCCFDSGNIDWLVKISEALIPDSVLQSALRHYFSFVFVNGLRGTPAKVSQRICSASGGGIPEWM